MLTLIGQDHRQIGVLIVVDIPQAKGNIFFFGEINLISFEGTLCRIKGQFLCDRAHFLKYITI